MHYNDATLATTMDPQVRLLFHELADLPQEERQRVLDERRIAPELRAELESLLSFDSEDARHLTACVSDAAEEVLQSAAGRDLPACGAYRLVRLLGRGGMGAVYLGERTDGEIQQTVAVKLLRADGCRPGWRDRFLRERQLLASLNHPSIVRVMDAGHTGDGQPYLVMEYVEGVSIDVRAATMDVRERLLLFLGVCEGVSHAHRHLIIHRDLKPSNLLVDKSGQAKVLDFGIARILDDTGDATQTVERLLTPNYASPEQLRGASQTTATDIYSLGAVLYKILTGRSPHESESHTSQAVEIVAGIREIPAPTRLNPKLPADVDYILGKTLRIEPEERYASVDALANDIRALLESRAIEARSGNAWYRTRKFVRRYRIPVAATVLVIASLAAGLYIANRQRLIAERRFSQLRQLAHQVLFDVDPALESLRGSIDARKKLLSTSTQYLAGLGADAAQDKQLALEVAESYIQVARIQGVPAWNNLGQYAEAVETLKKAETFLAPVLAADPDNRNVLWLSASAAHDLATAADGAGRPDEVIAGAAKVRESFDHLASLGNLTRKEINGATYMYANLADHFIQLHRFEDAARYARAGVEISRSNTTVPGPRAQAFSELSTALMDLGDLPGALDAIREARRQVAKLRHDEGDTLYTRGMIVVVHAQEGLLLGGDGVGLNRPLEAAATLREPLEFLEQLVRNDSKSYHELYFLGEVGRRLGDALRGSDPKQALTVYDHALMQIREIPNDVVARRTEALIHTGSSYALRRLHREPEARDRIEAGLRILRDTKDLPAAAIKPDSEAASALRALADHYAEAGDLPQAIAAYQDLRGKMLASNPDPGNDLVNAAQLSRLDAALAAVLRHTGRAGEAAVLEQNRQELWRQWSRKLPDNAFVQGQLDQFSH